MNGRTVRANSIDWSKIETIPSYSISPSEKTTEYFQLSTPVESIPDNNLPPFKPQDTDKNSRERLSNQVGNSPKSNISQQRTPNNSNSDKFSLYFLNQSPNPLQFPTKPEEVRIQKVQGITLNQALELARRNNRELQASLLDLEAARASLKSVQALLLPTVDLETNLNRSQSSQSQFQKIQQEQELQEQQNQIPEGQNLSQEAENEIQQAQSQIQDLDKPATTLDTALQFTYVLYTGGKRTADINKAEEGLRIQELKLEALGEQIHLNVSKEYFDLQQSDEQVRINQAAVRNAQASVRDAEALLEAGETTQLAVLQARVNLANAQQELTNAIASQKVARRSIVKLLGLSQSVNIFATDPVKLTGLWEQSLEQSIVQAYQNRSELQERIAERNISKFERRAALSARKPQISLVSRYDIFDQFDDSIGITDGLSIGVTATLSLYDGGKAKADAAQAKAQIQKSEVEFASTRNDIRFQVEEAYLNLQSNRENIQTSQAEVDQAEDSLELARVRFQAGVGTQSDVIDAENNLTRAQGNAVGAILDYNRAFVELQRSVTFR